MKRREFLHRSAWAAGAAALHASPLGRRALALGPLPRKFSATDTVTLGKTGIQTSRLAMGTGTIGFAHHSHQTKASRIYCCMGTTRGYAFSIPRTPMAATRTSPRR